MYKGGSLTLNIQDANHVKPILERLVAQEPAWKLTNGKDFRLKWVGPACEDHDLLALLHNNKIVNKYPDCKSLAEKDGFAEMTNFIYNIDPGTYHIAPLTFTPDCKYECQRLNDYMANYKSASYILKPKAGSQGDGAYIFKDFKDLPVTLEQGGFVVQRYLDKPLLL